MRASREERGARPRRALPAQLPLVLAGLLLGVAAGAAVAFAPFYLVFAALAGLAAGLAMLRSAQAGLAATLGVITLLPFGTLPVKIGLTPTLLELALLALGTTWILRLLASGGADAEVAGSPGRSTSLRLSPLAGPLLLFLGLSVFSFLIGSGGSPDMLTLHNYAKLVLGVLLCVSIVNVVRDRAQAALLLRVLVLGGGAAALLGLALYALPDALALRLLVTLGPLGYPTGGRVLRYVADDPGGLERAIGTSIDPNAFGGMLALLAAITLSQAFSRRPVLPRLILWGAFGVQALAIFLTYSRAALGGLVLAGLFLATVRYRRLWWLFSAGGIAALIMIGVLGKGEAFVQRLSEGVQFQDQANVMRLNEYRNALRIIEEYPVFGVGFGSAPSIDLTTGVSSIYLTIAERMGLVGLAVFALVVGVFFAFTTAAIRAAPDDSVADWLTGVQAAIVAALAVGVLDHYYFNIEFSHMVALFWGILGLGMALRHMIVARHS